MNEHGKGWALDTAAVTVPAVIRGQVFEDDLIEFGGRGDSLTFLAPDPQRLLSRLPLGDPGRLADLYRLTFADILDYLEALGKALDIRTNRHMQLAREISVLTAPVTRPLVEIQFENIPAMFARDAVLEQAETIGLRYLEGWAPHRLNDGRISHVRAIGARTVHIIAGNGANLAAWTLVRNAILRSDAIIKCPSNEPYTAVAIARTMLELAPEHPITRHFSVAYWKGGDTEFESRLYQPHNIEKIIAWGGFASVKHVSRYIQPGLELISLDPKRSLSIVGPEAFADDASLDDAATRLAADVGVHNQEGCVNARVAYVACGTDEAGLQRLQDFGQRVYHQLVNLPATVSTPPKGGINRELKAHIRAAALDDDFYRVIGGRDDEGAVILSMMSEPVEFAPSLNNRVANLVPVDKVEDMLKYVNSYTQTIGVYPPDMATQLRDTLALYGGQRIVPLGYATHFSYSTPQDGLEPLRRMCKWINHEECDPAVLRPIWES